VKKAEKKYNLKELAKKVETKGSKVFRSSI